MKGCSSGTQQIPLEMNDRDELATRHTHTFVHVQCIVQSHYSNNI